MMFQITYFNFEVKFVITAASSYYLKDMIYHIRFKYTLPLHLFDLLSVFLCFHLLDNFIGFPLSVL